MLTNETILPFAITHRANGLSVRDVYLSKIIIDLFSPVTSIFHAFFPLNASPSLTALATICVFSQFLLAPCAIPSSTAQVASFSKTLTCVFLQALASPLSSIAFQPLENLLPSPFNTVPTMIYIRDRLSVLLST